MTDWWTNLDLLCEIAVWLEMEDRRRMAMAVYSDKSQAEWTLTRISEVASKVSCVTNIGDVRCSDGTRLMVRYEVNGRWQNTCGTSVNRLFFHPDVSEVTRYTLLPTEMSSDWELIGDSMWRRRDDRL